MIKTRLLLLFSSLQRILLLLFIFAAEVIIIISIFKVDMWMMMPVEAWILLLMVLLVEAVVSS